MNIIKKTIAGIVLLLLVTIVVSLMGSFICWRFWHPFEWVSIMHTLDKGERALVLFAVLFVIFLDAFVVIGGEFDEWLFQNTPLDRY